LISKGFFNESQFIIMNDNQKDSYYPTKNNIINKFNDLLNLALQNKDKKIQYFIAYSGHGSNLPDTDGDEDDGFDECLCPVDCDQNGFIVDDYIRTEFIEKLPKNVNIVALIDACHSGTIMDLKYNYAIDKKNSYNANGIYKNALCNVVMISGCQDSQTSSDAYLPINQYGGMYKLKSKQFQYNGAMTSAFLASFQDNITYEQLIINIRTWLNNNKFVQLPQLSSSNLLDVKSKFLLGFYK